MQTRLGWLAIVGGLGLALQAAAAVEGPLPTRPVGAGRTCLLDEPMARVGYRLDGADAEVVLGDGWSGYDPVSGVWFELHGAPDAAGRRPVFMHCPWRRAPGVAFAEFALALPDLEPLGLDLATSLRADAPASDGVTCRVRVDGTVVFETHCTWKEPRPANVDLAAYRGRRVALRLDVDPGPARSCRDDWFLWGRADLVAGSPAQQAEAERHREQERQAALARDLERAQARASQSWLPLYNAPGGSMVPATFGAVTTDTEVTPAAWVFAARDAFDTLRYEVRPELGVAGEIAVRVTLNGQRLLPDPFVLVPQPLAGSADGGEPLSRLEVAPAGGGARARLTLRREPPGKDLALTLGAELTGKTLRLILDAPAGHFGGVRLERRGGTTLPAVYTPTPCTRYDAVDGYSAATADLWRCNASSAGARGTTYAALTDGSYRPLHDELLITVSSRAEETVPNLPHAPSPFLEDLSGRVLLDVWGGSFDHDAEWLRDLAVYGLDRLLIIKHVWQRDGYDRTYPNVFPANAAQGGDEGLRRLAAAARELGHRFCVHENFYDYYPNAEDFRPADCALRPDGSRIPGWDRGPVKAVIMKPSRVLDYAGRFSTPIRERYGCTAAYHDIMPTWHVDFDAAVPDSGMIRVTHDVTRQLCAFDRQLFGGPVLFEAADPLLAGVYDGGTANGAAIEDYPLLPLHELLRVHPRMSNHGMSYYERWLRWGYGPGWHDYVMTDRELDKYRALTVAFGRTGFIGHQLMVHPHGVVREYWLMRAFGRAYTGQRALNLRYAVGEAGDQWLDAPTAARYGQTQRLSVTYEGGQEVAVNAAPTPWTVHDVRLPPFGVVTRGPRALAWTALIDDQVADYAEVDGTVYADARSQVWQAVGLPPPIRAEAADFTDLGKGRFRLAVRWLPERVPERELTVFWHFLDDQRIAFQRDHQPGQPTAQWRPGVPVVDGPLELAVPASCTAVALTVSVGLYDRAGRATLAGGSDALVLGRLLVSRAEGQVTALRFEPAAAAEPVRSDPQRYLDGSNRSRRVLRFPCLATDGAVVVTRAPDAVDVVPVPLAASVRVGLPGTFAAVIALAADGSEAGRAAAQGVDGWTWFRTGDLPAAVRWRALSPARP